MQDMTAAMEGESGGGILGRRGGSAQSMGAALADGALSVRHESNCSTTSSRLLPFPQVARVEAWLLLRQTKSTGDRFAINFGTS